MAQKKVAPSDPAPTPRDLGFHMPAEWQRHQATWIAWPHNPTDWPGKLEAIHWVYGEMARKMAPGEILRILVKSEAHEALARNVLRRAGVALSRVKFHRLPTNRGWTRDCGPIFVRRPGTPRRADAAPETAIVRFRFNAWARYADWQKDDRVPEFAARALGKRMFRVMRPDRPEHPFVLEGGSIEVNGRGTLLTTEECLLDSRTQTRNPGLTRRPIEATLRESLGVKNVLWLGRGIAGDDTHGHVDDLCRFVNPRTAVLCREKNPRDANYRALQENWERIGGLRLEDGSRIEVVALPMPAPLVFQGQRLPASYANFYISNAAVLAPTFNDPQDRVALRILSELIKDRPVVGIHAVDLVWGLGTIHCLTQQQPVE